MPRGGEDIWWGLDTHLSTPKGWKAELAWWTIYWILKVTPNIWGPALMFRFMLTQVEPKLVKISKGYFVKLINLCWNRITVVTFNCPWKLADWNFLIFFGSPINRAAMASKSSWFLERELPLAACSYTLISCETRCIRQTCCKHRWTLSVIKLRPN